MLFGNGSAFVSVHMSGIDSGIRPRSGEIWRRAMGSGEFDGGSSVTWKITHSDGDSGSGNQHGARGKDKHPKGPNGTFVVEVTGHPPIFAPTRNTIVRVAWGDSVQSTPAAATAAKTAKSKTRRAKKG